MGCCSERRLPLIAGLSILFTLAAGCQPAAAHVPRAYVRRLHFAPGQRSIVIRDGFSPHHCPPVFTLYARRGGHLRIMLRNLIPPGQKPDDDLVTTYYITLPSGKNYGLKGYDPFDGRLTETGLYRLIVGVNRMASNGRSGRFRLTLSR